MTFLSKYWMWILGAVVVAALIVVILKKMKQPKVINLSPVPIPPPVNNAGATGSTGTDTGTGGVGTSPTVTGEQIRAITLALYEDMDGFNWIGHNMQPYEDLAHGSDQLNVSVYNDFNALYLNEGKGTLKKWILDEQFAQSDTTDLVLDRFSTLNLQ